MKSLVNMLRDPSVVTSEIDGENRLVIHERMLARKKMMREVFADFHHMFDRLDRKFFSAKGLRVELGAGVGPIRSSYPDVLATDIVPCASLDRVIDSEQMDFENESVRVIFGQNCFHHFPHPERFFNELNRVLPVGGGAILLEPYYGPVAAFIYKRLFPTETFDRNFPSWEVPATGPMSGANQALSYIVFKRDRAEFERRFSNLEIVHHEICENYLRYLFSGGLNFRQLCPDWATPLFRVAEFLLSPLNRWIALHHVIVLRKRAAK